MTGFMLFLALLLIYLGATHSISNLFRSKPAT